MNGTRQKTPVQLELALVRRHRGEAPINGAKGIETFTATNDIVIEGDTERLTDTTRLMEEVCEKENLVYALKRVRANKGKPGSDRMTVRELPAYLKTHWPRIREELLAGTYTPKPVRRVEIRKPDGSGMRKLGIPTVLDRFIQQAVLQVLQARWDKTFSEHSYGFRPERSAHDAVAAARDYIAEGNAWVVDIDLEKFFDRVNHDMLMGRVAKRVADRRVRKLIRAFLNAGVMENGLWSPTDEGTPQGGPLSPLLSNLMLDDLDRELEKRGLRFARYADDCNIYVASERAGRRVMESVSRFITKRLKLKVNESKSAVARPKERKFLGFSFTSDSPPKRRVASKSVERFKNRVREITDQARGKSIESTIRELASYLDGWRNYYAPCEVTWIFPKLDKWIRRRLRAAIWRQWRLPRKRYSELRKLGADHILAASAAGCAYGPWRMSRTPALYYSLRNAYFHSRGLPKLARSYA